MSLGFLKGISADPRYRVGLMAKKHGKSLNHWKIKRFKYAQWAYLIPFQTSSLRDNQPQTKARAMGIQKHALVGIKEERFLLRQQQN